MLFIQVNVNALYNVVIRNYQKKSPSIALTPDRRAEVGALAIKAAKSVHYNNIGTVEFLLDLKTNQFNFMEINPRIQVEHGVTEAVTGIDPCAHTNSHSSW